MPYTKSYSNYVLRKKHQNSSRGTIYERDITTIGGRDQFAKGQIPIYKSGNFVITINNGREFYKKTTPSEWYRNYKSDVWTEDEIASYIKDEKSSYDRKIEIKKDFYDLRDFAYYGSCSELIRSSINDIIKTFPGELFTPDDGGGIMFKYTEIADGVEYDRYDEYPCGTIFDYNAKKIIVHGQPPIQMPEGGSCYAVIEKGVGVYYTKDGESYRLGEELGQFYPVLMDNPFGIDIYSQSLPKDGDPLKFFADGGIENYVAYYRKDGVWNYSMPYDIYVIDSKYEDSDCVTAGDLLATITFGFSAKTDDFSVTEHIHFESGETEQNVPVIENSDNTDNIINVRNDEQIIKLQCTDGVITRDITLTVYVYVGDNHSIYYLVKPKYINMPGDNSCECPDETCDTPFNIRIRPKESIINDYYSNLNGLQRTLLNRLSEPKYSAKFEIIDEDDNGYFTYNDTFTFPTTNGGYNLDVFSSSYHNYISRLSSIGDFYDERFSDNLWRSMTHESIKNFDWSANAEDYIDGGNKVQKLIRVWGREFDEIKGYIDAIKSYNKVTYDDSNNLPIYLYTDKLEDDGWDLKPTYWLELIEYLGDFNTRFTWEMFTGETEESIAEAEKSNSYDDKEIKRVFVQDKAIAGNIKVRPYSRQSTHKSYCNEDISTYTDNVEYNYTETNNEFMKRLLLNSKYILRKKGTIDGMEAILSMFNLKSKNFVLSNELYFKNSDDSIELTEQGKSYYGVSSIDEIVNKLLPYDYEIKEYTLFTNRIEDPWLDVKGMNAIDWINSTKSITYNSENFLNGIYDSYQGLMVAYREGDDNSKLLYPKFTVGNEYDGDPYYQMNGGWLSKKPFMFDNNNNILLTDIDKETETRRDDILFTETVRDIHTVQTLKELLQYSSLATHNGDVCQVIDLSGRYAIVDGILYDLYVENAEGGENEGFNYFYADIESGSLVVGRSYFDDFVVICNPYMENGKQKINLQDEYYYNRRIKIYVIKDENGKYYTDVHSSNESISTFMVFENGQYMDGDNFTNFFRINNIDNYDELSVFGWQQLRSNEYEYYKLNTLSDYSKGNNPHTGHMVYDNGHEYLTYFKNIFKHSYDNDLFDYRYYMSDDDIELLNNYVTTGFSGLVNEDICEKDYDEFLVEDSKVHYFGDFLYNGSEGVIKKLKYAYDVKSDDEYDLTEVATKRIISNTDFSVENPLYGQDNDGDLDGVTNQIVNTKRINIDFFLKNEVKYSKEWLEEIKYLDYIVLSYLSQMIPSNAICSINYVTKEHK